MQSSYKHLFFLSVFSCVNFLALLCSFSVFAEGDGALLNSNNLQQASFSTTPLSLNDLKNKEKYPGKINSLSDNTATNLEVEILEQKNFYSDTYDLPQDVKDMVSEETLAETLGSKPLKISPQADQILEGSETTVGVEELEVQKFYSDTYEIPEDVRDIVSKETLKELSVVSPRIIHEKYKTHDLEPKGSGISLKRAIQLAAEYNRDIQASFMDQSIALQELKKSQSVYDPKLFERNTVSRINRPVQSILDNGNEEDDTFLEHGWHVQAGVEQPLPTGGALSLFTDVAGLTNSSELLTPNPQSKISVTAQIRQSLLKEIGDVTNRSKIDIAHINLDKSSGQLEDTFSDILKEVGVSYWKFRYFSEKLVLAKKALLSVKDIYDNEKLRNEKGFTNLLDVDRAYAAVQDRLRDSVISYSQFMDEMYYLKKILGGSPASSLYETDLLPTDAFNDIIIEIDKPRELRTALAQRSEIQVVKKKISAATVRKAMASHKRLPDLDATASYTLNTLGDDPENAYQDIPKRDHASWELGLEFNWVMGGRKAEAEYHKSTLEYKKAKTEYQKTVEQVTYDINTIVNSIDKAEKQIDIAKEARDTNARILDREQARFELKKTSNRDLLKAHSTYFDSEKDYLKALWNYNTAKLRLSWANGTLIKKFDVKL